MLIGALAALAGYYLAFYLGSAERPNPASALPLGWWGWYDQGEYLKSIQAFAKGTLASPSDFLYPPLYPLISAPFWWATHDHPTLVPNLVCLLVAYGVVIAVARRFYGTLPPLLVCAALLLFFPIITITQWVIPWTTSLQTALASVLIAVFSRSETKAAPFALGSKADWGWFVGFFLAYGAIAPTRPLDMVVWFPFALAYFVRVGLATLGETPAGRRIAIAALCLAAAAASALVSVTAYLAFNLKVHGSLFGAYAAVAGANGYFPEDVVEKALSILRASGDVYGETGQALFERLPIFGPIFAACLVSLALVKGIRRWILLTAFLNIAVYLPYGDFLPIGFFRYYNLHYFKWAYPWLAVIGTGQLLFWLKTVRAHWAPLAASALLVLAGGLIGLRPVERERVAVIRSSADHRLLGMARKAETVEFIDLDGVMGGFEGLALGPNTLKLAGVVQPVQTYRLLPSPKGARLTFMKPTTVRGFELKPGPYAVVEDGAGQASFNTTAVGLNCAIAPCYFSRPPVAIAWSPEGAIAFDFRSDSDSAMHGADMSAWWSPESWGRWSRGAKTRMSLVVAPARQITVQTHARPLLGSTREKGKVQLFANGCKVAEEMFRAGQPERRIGGDVPAFCLRPDGRLTIEWRTEAKARPVDLKVNADPRKLGVAVRDLTLRRGP